jgi:hypothetical protein
MYIRRCMVLFWIITLSSILPFNSTHLNAQQVAPELEYYQYDKPSDIPILLFAQEPEFNDVSLSPDG